MALHRFPWPAQRKTGECFGLNGAIFLGSILLWDYGLAPVMRWLLTGLSSWTSPAGAEALLAVLQAVFIIWWLLPVYCISFALSCVWCATLGSYSLFCWCYEALPHILTSCTLIILTLALIYVHRVHHWTTEGRKPSKEVQVHRHRPWNRRDG
jgi:magnesium-transporting ATPase (P-type)